MADGNLTDKVKTTQKYADMTHQNSALATTKMSLFHRMFNSKQPVSKRRQTKQNACQKKYNLQKKARAETKLLVDSGVTTMEQRPQGQIMEQKQKRAHLAENDMKMVKRTAKGAKIGAKDSPTVTFTEEVAKTGGEVNNSAIVMMTKAETRAETFVKWNVNIASKEGMN